jgi:RNA polymerase sigma-70 factor (ECF subfamily)
MDEEIERLIERCIKGERNAQSSLYSGLAPKMFTVCLRYSRNREEAEEILQEGFTRVFESLQQFRSEGSFEGWVRKIMVNCALQKYRSRSSLQVIVNIHGLNYEQASDEDISAKLGAKELLKLVQLLPAGYRMVFNLYVFEGMKHREIATLLNISEGTSKSNLSDARTLLRKMVLEQGVVARQINN